MTEKFDDSISRIKSRLLDGMLEFMEPDEEFPDEDHDCGYSQTNIDQCESILEAYLDKIRASEMSKGQSEILEAVQGVVIELNELNYDCGGSLIETEQREDLCEIILIAAKQAGLESDDDVTEQWRQW